MRMVVEHLPLEGFTAIKFLSEETGKYIMFKLATKDHYLFDLRYEDVPKLSLFINEILEAREALKVNEEKVEDQACGTE